jgi:protein phosphatase
VEDGEIESIIRNTHPQQATQELVDLANERGGKDNITVLIISAQEELETVRALPVASAEAKAIRRSWVTLAIVIALAILALALGGLAAAHLLTGDKPDEGPVISPPVATATLVPEPSAQVTGETIPDSSGSPFSPSADKAQAPATPRPEAENTLVRTVVAGPSIPGSD